MGMSMLLDGFAGNPTELYNLVVEEINSRELSDFKYSWGEALEANKLFNKGTRAQTLCIDFRGRRATVLGYQIGRIFHVSLRTIILKEAEGYKALQLGFLHHITDEVYEAVVSRSVTAAVKRLLEAHNAPVPKELDPESIFYSSEAVAS